MAKIALITGISGQDGAYLAKFLLKKKYKIIGTVKSILKRSSRNGNQYYFIILGDDTGEAKTMFFKYEQYLGRGNSLPEKGSIVILTGTKSDSTIFVNDMKLLDNKVYMKLSDLK